VPRRRGDESSGGLRGHAVSSLGWRAVG
jgi:hypothetical protein